MSVYAIAQLKITNRAAYDRYQAMGNLYRGDAEKTNKFEGRSFKFVRCVSDFS